MADPNGWPDPMRIARLMVNAYTRDDRRRPTSRDVEIARVLCADLAAEVAALVAAGQEAMREACAEIAECDAVTPEDEAGRQYVIRDGDPGIADAIREMPLPSAPEALAAIRAEARREGMEKAAGIAKEQEVHLSHSHLRQFPNDAGRLIDDIAAAIRAAAKEGKS